jgi:hypothetical protein
MAKQNDVMTLIDSINERLDSIEDSIWWLIKAKQRFHVGQRVKFSARAYAKGIASGVKGKVTRGRVVEVGDLFSIDVLLDGYKHPKSFHHSFFEEVWRPTNRRSKDAN